MVSDCFSCDRTFNIAYLDGGDLQSCLENVLDDPIKNAAIQFETSPFHLSPFFFEFVL